MLKALRGPGLFVAFALVLALGPSGAVAAPTFPPLTGRVVDDAHVLSPQVQADLDQKLTALEASTHRQLVVATLPSLQGYEIEDYGYQLGRAWKIGRAGFNDGAVFIIAPNEHKVRIEVGYGLEPVLTDAMSSLILQRAVLPRFKAGDIQGGVVQGTAAIIDQLSLPQDQAQANVAAATDQAARQPAQGHSGSPFSALPILLIIIFFVLSALRGGRRGYGGGLAGALPWMVLGSMAGRGGGGGGFGGGGGGFSGGGGSFGGGGASGGW